MTRHRLRSRFASERALALPMALLVLASTGAMVVGVIQYSSSSGRTAQIAKSRVSASALAEAGVAAAFAVLNNAVDPKTASLLPSSPPTVLSLEGGTATYWGTYNSTTYAWTITSVGSIPNPTGGAPLTKTLTRGAQVHGLNAGATVGAWSRMYHDNTSICMTITDVTITTPISSRGDLCLVGTAKITGATTTVDVGDDIRMTNDTESDSTRLAGAGSGWTNSGNIVSSNNSDATTSVAITRHGTLVNGSTYTTGQSGQAVDLDGNNDYVSLPAGAVEGLTDFSISTWVRLDSTASSRRLFDFGTGTTAYMYVVPTAGSTVRFGITTSGSGGEQVINGSTGLATGSWVHVAVTRIGNTGRLYVNGTQVGSNASMTLNPSSLGTTTQNWIGRSQSGGNYLDGRVDDFRIYNRGLSTAEVGTVQGGSTAPTGMLARYTFENNANDSVAFGGPSAVLQATGFGFAIPAGSQIRGVEAWVERKASASGSLSDNEVYLLKAGAQVGSNEASGTMYTTSDQTQAYGDDDDLWGTTWTVAEINASNFGLRFRVDSDTSAAYTASVDAITIRVTYLAPPGTSIGIESPLAAVNQVAVGGGCTYGTNAEHAPCTTADKVFATTINQSPQGLSKPQIDMAYWYDNAKPGPKFPCNNPGGSFPGGFDNNSSYDNSVNDAAEVTPNNSSYTCQRIDAYGNIEGEISWNHSTKVMLLKGTIFRDGDFRFDDDGAIAHYHGRGIIYAAGNIEFDELVCAGGTGNESCYTNGMSNWDPSLNMLTVLAGGDSEFDQGGTQAQAVPSGLQGIIYAKDDCTVHENFHLSGPIICDVISFPAAANGYPTYYPWPPLGSLTEGQAYGSPNDAADYIVTAGEQLG